MRTFLLIVVCCVALVACQNFCRLNIAEERIPRGESADIRFVADAAAGIAPARDREAFDRGEGDGTVLRSFHPKAHGCVRASFRVLSTPPSDFQHGLFARRACYPAWLRFDNAGTSRPGPDNVNAVRGVGIKLMDVSGTKLRLDLDDDDDDEINDNDTNFDFLLNSDPRFFSKDMSQLVELVKALFVNNNFTGFAAAHPDTTAVIVDQDTKGGQIGNVLGTTFWSQTPFLHGANRAAKYRMIPCNGTLFAAPPGDNTTPNYLHDRLRATLLTQSTCFFFQAQLQRDPCRQPIEDATVEWSETLSPFETLAIVDLHQQDIDLNSATQCENFYITPWRKIQQHRPLGGINRGRNRIYEQAIALRHGANGVETRATEPQARGCPFTQNTPAPGPQK